MILPNIKSNIYSVGCVTFVERMSRHQKTLAKKNTNTCKSSRLPVMNFLRVNVLDTYKGCNKQAYTGCALSKFHPRIGAKATQCAVFFIQCTLCKLYTVYAVYNLNLQCTRFVKWTDSAEVSICGRGYKQFIKILASQTTPR